MKHLHTAVLCLIAGFLAYWFIVHLVFLVVIACVFLALLIGIPFLNRKGYFKW
jgi:hypothetical protein